MNSEIIAEAAQVTLVGTLPFPEIVRRLMETGAEYYHVDYVALIHHKEDMKIFWGLVECE